MKSYESKAKTVEEAISLGLEKLGASIADVKIDIVSEGGKGFLGFLGAKPAVVNLTMKEDEAEPSVVEQILEASKETSKSVKDQAEKVKQAVKEKVVEKKQELAEAAAEVEKTDAAEVIATAVEKTAQEAKAVEFLANLTKLMGVNVTINSHVDEEGNVRVDMHGDTLGILIGRRGETLDAVQYLTSLYVNRGQEGYTRVTLDTENYRAKREEALIRLANRMANRAVKTGRKVSLEPMNPYERRILHSALQKNDAVTTHSEGEEPNRHVVITVK
ncbi:MAG: Jag N-terminal domain-containing protein [Clostridia bacterium]|nr:Jag N-terminal domain-containing protein [Clostridia bacterium]